MRLLIVRHADPDYSIDSLTPAGWEEQSFWQTVWHRFWWRLIMYRRWGVRRHGVPDLKKSLPHGRNLQLAAWICPAGGTSGKGFRALCLGLAAGCVDGGAEVF